MSETTGAAADALFRANKRRKIYRKRNVDDQDDDGAIHTGNPTGPDSGGLEQRQTVRRPAVKKHGIGFSTAGSRTAPDEVPATQTAIVPFQSEQDEDPSANDRFVKPAGKAAVVEDKHLTAYVDSKLAELRSSSSTPNSQQIAALEASTGSALDPIKSSSNTGAEGEESHALEGQQQRQRNNQRVRPTKSRRGPPQRGADDIARDAMVDQIMRESQVPIYEQSSSNSQRQEPTGFDADEAAAEAFRAEFLLSLEEQQNRRPRPAPPVQQRGAPPVPTGPKLGGSRAQREKMKAIEEAKAAGKTVDAMPKRR